MERPTLNFENAADGETISISFGYFGDDQEPTAALIHRDKIILIPVSVLATAVSSGWENDYSILCETLKEDPDCPECRAVE